MSKKKMTAGERIVSRTFEDALKTYCCNGMFGQKAIYDLARRIDAAISREVKKAVEAERANPRSCPESSITAWGEHLLSKKSARPRSRKP
jgi:hypothetical protein